LAALDGYLVGSCELLLLREGMCQVLAWVAFDASICSTKIT